MSRHPDRGDNQSERTFLTKLAVASGFVITWFLGSLAAELLGDQANATSVGQLAGRFLLIVLVVVAPLTALTWGGIKLWQWRHPPAPEVARTTPVEIAPPEPEPPAWRSPGPIYDRDDDVANVVRTLLDTGAVLVCGARDVGTSAVAEAAVQKLIDERRTEARFVVRLDLRSRSSRTPDDARATAGRILSTFRQDEPANGTPEVLANAAERLHDTLARQYAVLLLDNVSVPDEIEWLIPQWLERNNRQPWLVIAGETAIGTVAPDNQITVGSLSTDGMRRIWYADTDTAPPQPGPSARWVDELLAKCGGRPRAIKAVARETTGPNREAEVHDLLVAMNADENNPLVEIWRAILLRTEGSLTPDASWLLHALAVLPVTALTPEAICALVAVRAPGTEAGVFPPAAFDELRVRDIVQQVGDRYRLPQEIRGAIIGQTNPADKEKNTETARIAVPALTRHLAERVVHQADQLDVRSAGADAAKWLHQEEPTLRPLFSAEHYRDDRLLLLAVIDDLARIAGALEYWYVREQQADGLLQVSTVLCELANLAQRPGLSALAAARKATAHRMLEHRAEARKLLTLVAGEARAATNHGLGAELTTRLHVEHALLAIATPAVPSTEDEAGHALAAAADAERVKLRRALEGITTRKRHPGAGIAMLNLGAFHLRHGSSELAVRYLVEAEAMARERFDTGCQAQAVELRGIALAASDLTEAVSLWQEALQLFEDIAEEQGQARCLQHLGAAALTDPTIAARLTDEENVCPATVARPLLERSKQLRAGQPNTALVDEYLRAATASSSPAAERARPT